MLQFEQFSNSSLLWSIWQLEVFQREGEREREVFFGSKSSQKQKTREPLYFARCWDLPDRQTPLGSWALSQWSSLRSAIVGSDPRVAQRVFWVSWWVWSCGCLRKNEKPSKSQEHLYICILMLHSLFMLFLFYSIPICLEITFLGYWNNISGSVKNNIAASPPPTRNTTLHGFSLFTVRLFIERPKDLQHRQTHKCSWCFCFCFFYTFKVWARDPSLGDLGSQILAHCAVRLLSSHSGSYFSRLLPLNSLLLFALDIIGWCTKELSALVQSTCSCTVAALSALGALDEI